MKKTAAENRPLVEILREARRLIESGWTRGTAARDTRGDPVSPHYRDAVCWCLTGAINHALGPDASVAEFRRVEGALVNAVGTERLERWNDTIDRTQEEVLAVVDRAIKLAEGGTP